jgi:hypothetical protein
MSAEPAKRENLVVNLVCNIVVPSAILSYLSGDGRLGPVYALILALLFPLGYFAWDFARRRQANFIAIIGFVSILATGGLGLMKVDGFWFAVKEAAVPVIIALGVLASLKTRRPLVRELLFNDQVLDVAKVEACLDARGTRPDFDVLLFRCSLLLVGSFLISAALNFALARWLLVSEPGTEAFNAELAKMNLWSWPVIVIPSMGMTMFALWRLLSGVTRLSGLSLDDLFHPPAPKA